MAFNFWPTHRHSQLPLAGASLRSPSSKQLPYDDWQRLTGAPAMVGNDWHRYQYFQRHLTITSVWAATTAEQPGMADRISSHEHIVGTSEYW
jgi:hypothetical protein